MEPDLPSQYRELDAQHIIATITRLEDRIRERLPGRHLYHVATQLGEFAREAGANIAWYKRPHIPLRLLIALFVAVIPGAILLVVLLGHFEAVSIQLHEFIQTMEAMLASIVFIGAAVIFIVSLERRIKRSRVITHLDQLRSLAHIVDMHQLTKDPDRIVRSQDATATKSSPKVTLNAFQLGRYLDYCSEMMALISKVAALYAQASVDPEIGAAVLEVEGLTTGLSRKIWQKVVILQEMFASKEKQRNREQPTVGTEQRSVGTEPDSVRPTS
jgi:hypothetical protein